MKDTEKIINFIHYAEGLKTELRHATKSNYQKESVADHSWRLALFVMMVLPKLTIEINHQRALKMAIIHDIVEIEAKDIPILEHIADKDIAAKKMATEKLAIAKVKRILGPNNHELIDLWQEFEEGQSSEAKVVKALDKLEGQLQFLKDPIRHFNQNEQVSIKLLIERTSELCRIDPFLVQLDQLTLEERQERIKPID